MKKTCFCLCLLLSFLLNACGQSPAAPSGEQTPAEENSDVLLSGEQEKTETLRADYPDNLPAKTYDGRNFTLLTRDGYSTKFQPEEITGEAVNDAVYERNSKISDEYDIEIQNVSRPCDWGTTSKSWNDDLYASVLANDGAYDLIAGYASTVPEIVTKEILFNWNDVPYIAKNEPWWSERASEALTIHGRQYFLTGDYSISLWDNIYGCFFNKQLAEDYQIGDLYQMVREKQWTLDTLLALCDIVSWDVDGNGIYDENDIYCISSDFGPAIDTYQISCQMNVVSPTEDGGLKLTLNSERAVSILEKVNRIYNDSHGGFPSYDVPLTVKVFTENRALFLTTYFENINLMRDMENDYGILPYPMYDETQENYANTSRDNFDLFAVPIDVLDVEFTGIITEALCAESWRSVIPKYYDIVLKTKTSRDEESSEMLDLIRDTLTFDIGYLCSTSLENVGHIFVNLVRENSNTLASRFASVEQAAQVKLDEMLAAYGYQK
ncbi:MAG: hypothetical protein ACI4V1_00410 [Eubacteriales bacterium]